MPHDLRALALALLTASLLACSSSDFALSDPETAVTEEDGGDGDDTSVGPDTGAPPEDTSVTPDSNTPPPDSSALDTNLPETRSDTGCICPGVGDCQTAVCAGSVCNITNKVPGTPCSGGKCDGGGKCVQCTTSSDCGPGAPHCDGGKCVQCVNASHCPGAMSECKQAACTAGTCAIVPKPRDTLCNGFADQCDGAGNCVDCTNSGGCGECCVCKSQTCVPA